MKNLHELHEHGIDRKGEFCEEIINLIREKRNLLKNICFSNKCILFKWICQQSQLLLLDWWELTSQLLKKLNVLPGIFGDSVIGTVFFLRNLTDDAYLNLFEEVINLPIITLIENRMD